MLNPNAPRPDAAADRPAAGRSSRPRSTEAANKLGKSLQPDRRGRAGQGPAQAAQRRLPRASRRSRSSTASSCPACCSRPGDRRSRSLVAQVRHDADGPRPTSSWPAGVGFYLPGIVVGNIKKKRSEAIFLGLPDALDLMVVCVEAGLGLDAAMRRVTTELATSCPVLCEEFAIANFQVQMGRARKDVLRDLGIRTGVDDVRSLAAVIIQAEKFGSSIGVGAARPVRRDAAASAGSSPRSGRPRRR